ncbi:hypothetical protein LENED_004116 [Lentinula edodes]|uniref:Uncharacterized protein n=1 Tax=Lentinula edodes TaxID=5353 RepID=A0A1Q3E5F3_LENED|nr:uncharacterized protein C8R40DRAFT_1176253 [Lentinula edodes]KAH7869928.1 hypothetical protein C8R40DRAFT_1176253 [Lentinula edodes]GAW02458.1 hypothetical protein LENED_004116 [Lentinula edodes]
MATKELKTLEKLHMIIKDEAANHRGKEDAGLLSTLARLEKGEKKLAVLVNQVSHEIEVLIDNHELRGHEEEQEGEKDLILNVALQTEVTRALEMRSALPGNLLDTDLLDLEWLAEVIENILNGDTESNKLDLLRRLQAASAKTLSRALEWLADVM